MYGLDSRKVGTAAEPLAILFAAEHISLFSMLSVAIICHWIAISDRSQGTYTVRASPETTQDASSLR